MRIVLALLACLLALSSVDARPPRGSPTGAVAAGWHRLLLGSGGYARGMNVAPDGTMVAHTDTNGAYYYNGTQWTQVFSSSSLPGSLISSTDIANIGNGCFEIMSAPSSTSTFYGAYLGYVWKSTNHGSTWTQTGFTQNAGGMNPNDSYSQFGQRMAVDPNNANIVFVGTENQGLWISTNGGASFTQVSITVLPVGTNAGIVGILFNGNGTVTGGATQTVYAASNSHGLYVSNDGGSTWTLTSGGPTVINSGAIDSTGNYYAGTAAGLYKYSGGSWSTMFTDANGIQAIAINPFNNAEVVAIRPSGWVNVSYNSGGTWSGANFKTGVVSTDVPWFVNANTQSAGIIYLDAGGAAFSPTTNGELILSAGTGTWQMSIPSSGFTSSTVINWTDFTPTIEQMVANQILIPPSPGATPILVSWDRPFFDITSLSSYPSTYGPVNSSNITMGWSADYASSSPSTVVGLSTWNGSSISGVTTNNGATWTNFSSMWSTGNGGSIAASTPSNIIWAPSGSQPAYTLNGGASWTGITISGISSWSGLQPAYFFRARSITADRVTANTFYMYFPGTGVYTTANGGAAWTLQHSGYIESNHSLAGSHSAILSVPGNAGNLFYTPGPIGGTTPASPVTEPFYRSVDGGVTWTVVSGVNAVTTFNFGAIAPSHTYPSIYIVGFVGGTYGVYYSVDNAATWTSIGNPNASLQGLQLVDSIAADPNNFGSVIVGTGGAGYEYYP